MSKARQIDSSDTNWGGEYGTILCRAPCEKVGVGGQYGIAAIPVINLHINRSSM